MQHEPQGRLLGQRHGQSFFSSLAFELERDARWYDVHDVERDLVEYIDRFYNSEVSSSDVALVGKEEEAA